MRRQILKAISTTLEPLDFVFAMWQGGSEAHGCTDEWSDLDIVTIVADDRVEETFATVEQALMEIAAIEFKWRVPEPTWHGHSQSFWRLQNTSPYLFIDFAVMKSSSSNRFLETRRHGKAVIAFDKENLLIPPTFDRQEHFARMRSRFEYLKTLFDFQQILVKKEINRGLLIEAIANYHTRTLSYLIELLGMVYRPDRYDFGVKYFSRDFPVAIVDRVQSLYCIANFEDLVEKRQLAEAIFKETLPLVEAALNTERVRVDRTI